MFYSNIKIKTENKDVIERNPPFLWANCLLLPSALFSQSSESHKGEIKHERVTPNY